MSLEEKMIFDSKCEHLPPEAKERLEFLLKDIENF